MINLSESMYNRSNLNPFLLFSYRQYMNAKIKIQVENIMYNLDFLIRFKVWRTLKNSIFKIYQLKANQILECTRRKSWIIFDQIRKTQNYNNQTLLLITNFTRQ